MNKIMNFIKSVTSCHQILDCRYMTELFKFSSIAYSSMNTNDTNTNAFI